MKRRLIYKNGWLIRLLTDKDQAERTTKIKRNVGKPELEEALWEWYCSQRELSRAVTGDAFKVLANRLHPMLYKDEDGNGIEWPVERISDGWLGRFKNRYGIRKIKKTGETPSGSGRSILKKTDANRHIMELIHFSEAHTDDLGPIAVEVSVLLRKFARVVKKSATETTRGETAPGNQLMAPRGNMSLSRPFSWESLSLYNYTNMSI